MVKLVDVAREAEVSVATVSRALNNNETVDPQLAARVRAAALKLGYRPNYLARNLRRQRTSLWLLIISDIENAFFTSVARGVEDAALASQFSVALCNTDEDEDKEAGYISLAIGEQAAGVIVSPHSTQSDITPLLAAKIPVVVIDRELTEPVDSVTTDSRGGAQGATEHLLAQGWSRPGCITGPRSAQTANLRRLGYEDALRAASIRTSRSSTARSRSTAAGLPPSTCSTRAARPTPCSSATPSSGSECSRSCVPAAFGPATISA